MAAIIVVALVARMARFPIHALSINNDVHPSTDRRTTLRDPLERNLLAHASDFQVA